MRSARDFFKPLAIGAPEPPREIPFRPCIAAKGSAGENPERSGQRLGNGAPTTIRGGCFDSSALPELVLPNPPA